ncbi:MAG: hypothetical protein ACLUGJ_14075 [Blautia wexlerae]
MEGNMQEYLTEKKAREKRLAVYTEKIQETVLNKSAETIRLLVEERHNQKMTQQELSVILRGYSRQTWRVLKAVAGYRH